MDSLEQFEENVKTHFEYKSVISFHEFLLEYINKQTSLCEEEKVLVFL